MNRTISVIISVYNSENYIKACLDSVIHQTYKDLEIVAVNDGSTDSSGTIIDEYAKTDSRIKHVKIENSGLAAARNVGLKNATGDYLMFVDGDDQISDTICETLMDLLESNDCGMAVCEALHVYDETNIQYCLEGNNCVLTSDEAINEVWYQKRILPSVWGKLYKKQCFETIQFVENVVYDDTHIIHHIFTEAKRIALTEQKLYAYIHREGSILTKTFSKKNLEELDIAEELIAYGKQNPKVQKAAQSFAISCALRIYLNAPKDPMFDEAIMHAKMLIKEYGKSVLFDPSVRKKSKLALAMYYCCRPLMKVVYKRVNRWESS